MRTKQLAQRRMRCTPCYIEPYADVHHVTCIAASPTCSDAFSTGSGKRRMGCSSMHIAFSDAFGLDFEVSHDNNKQVQEYCCSGRGSRWHPTVSRRGHSVYSTS